MAAGASHQEVDRGGRLGSRVAFLVQDFERGAKRIERARSVPGQAQEGLDEHAKMSIWSVGWRTGADALAARRPQVPAVARTCIVTVGNYKAEQSPVEISALAERIAQGSCYPGEEILTAANWRIAAGGQGSVGMGLYYDGGIWHKCAAKTFDISITPRSLRDFKNECAMLKCVQGYKRSINMLRASISPDGSRARIALPLAECSLADYIRRGGYSLHTALRMGFHVLCAVEEIQERNIMHRDMKSANVLVFGCEQGGKTAKLTDFGCACDWTDEEAMQLCPGTHIYMTPEVFGCRPYNHNIDNFGAMLVMLELLTGEVGWEQSTTTPVDLQTTFTKVQSLVRRVYRTHYPNPTRPEEASLEKISLGEFRDQMDVLLTEALVRRMPSWVLMGEHDLPGLFDDIKKLVIDGLCPLPNQRPEMYKLIAATDRILTHMEDWAEKHDLDLDEISGPTKISVGVDLGQGSHIPVCSQASSCQDCLSMFAAMAADRVDSQPASHTGSSCSGMSVFGAMAASWCDSHPASEAGSCSSCSSEKPSACVVSSRGESSARLSSRSCSVCSGMALGSEKAAWWTDSKASREYAHTGAGSSCCSQLPACITPAGEQASGSQPSSCPSADSRAGGSSASCSQSAGSRSRCGLLRNREVSCCSSGSGSCSSGTGSGRSVKGESATCSSRSSHGSQSRRAHMGAENGGSGAVAGSADKAQSEAISGHTSSIRSGRVCTGCSSSSSAGAASWAGASEGGDLSMCGSHMSPDMADCLHSTPRRKVMPGRAAMDWYIGTRRGDSCASSVSGSSNSGENAGLAFITLNEQLATGATKPGLQSAMKTDQEAVVLIELATEAMTAPQHKTQAVRDGDNIGKGKTRPGFWRSLMACFVGA